MILVKALEGQCYHKKKIRYLAFTTIYKPKLAGRKLKIIQAYGQTDFNYGFESCYQANKTEELWHQKNYSYKK